MTSPGSWTRASPDAAPGGRPSRRRRARRRRPLPETLDCRGSRGAPSPIAGHHTGGRLVKALKTVAIALGITLGALIVIPLLILAGLFVWLKLTEESDEEALELD